MRIVVVGGTGHIGTFLIPRLVRAGHEVLSISRGGRAAYTRVPEWQQVRQEIRDRYYEPVNRAPSYQQPVRGEMMDHAVVPLCDQRAQETSPLQR